jgi:hypothetical protein
VAGFGFPAATGTFALNITCVVPPLGDGGDAPVEAGLPVHTNAGTAERLGTDVTLETGNVTPAWFGDLGDDGIVSVSDLFPGSTTATIVVLAANPTGRRRTSAASGSIART